MAFSSLIKKTGLANIIKTVFNKIENLVYRVKNRERKIKYGGENPDIKFYITGFNCGWNGVGWIILHVLEHLKYAEDKKYTPVIDFSNFKSQYSDNSEKENIWENWFEQPTQYNTQSILTSKNIIKSKNNTSPAAKYRIDYFSINNKAKIAQLRAICKKYIKINSETLEQILELQNNIIGKKKVLGVLCRGTDLTAIKPHKHPIQPLPQELIEEAKVVMKKHCCTHIFLATEDKEIYESFHSEFGDFLLSVPQNRFSEGDIGQDKSLSELSNVKNRKNMAFSYLASMYILSKCPCFIGGISGGSIVASIMSDGFEFEHLWDIGEYENDNETLSDAWKNLCDELSGKRMRK